MTNELEHATRKYIMGESVAVGAPLAVFDDGRAYAVDCALVGKYQPFGIARRALAAGETASLGRSGDDFDVIEFATFVFPSPGGKYMGAQNCGSSAQVCEDVEE